MRRAAGLLLAVLLLARPAAGQERDAGGSPLAPGVAERLEALEGSLGDRRLSPTEREFVLLLLNAPPVDSGPFKDREALVRHFARQGVAVRAVPSSGLQESDLYRLVLAARAASESFRIPPAILLCLTFRESSFDSRASAWTTSAKGVGQMTNAAVVEVIRQIQRDPRLRTAAELYAERLGARLPTGVEGAPDVDALTARLQGLRESGAPRSLIEEKRRERQTAIASHKDELGHIYNLETNFGLAAAYLSYLRLRRLAEVADEERAWLTAVAAYNQGLGTANELIYKVFRGPQDFNVQPLDAIFSRQTAAGLSIPPKRQEEMLGEVGSVRSCAAP